MIRLGLKRAGLVSRKFLECADLSRFLASGKVSTRKRQHVAALMGSGEKQQDMKALKTLLPLPSDEVLRKPGGRMS